MLALVEILALIVLNALIHAAFTRWKSTRRRAGLKRSNTRVAFHYPQHPSPAAALSAAPETAGYIRPAGIDW